MQFEREGSMKVEGLNVEVLVVVKSRKGEMRFRWRDLAFSQIDLALFGLGSDASPHVGIFVFRKHPRMEDVSYFVEDETRAAFSMGGHYNGGPAMRKVGSEGKIEGGALSASDFRLDDRIFIIGHDEELTEERVQFLTRRR